MKKGGHEEHANHERWAIPYADLMTLLLAFFVVMYSLSAINEAKYRVLAESINEAFNGTGKVIEPVSPAAPARQVPLPDEARAANATPIALIKVPVAPRHLPLPGHEGAAAQPSQGEQTQMASLRSIGDKVEKALKPWIDARQVIVRRTRFWLEIEIRTDILFPSGVARLSPSAQDVLDDVSGVLAGFPNPVRVEGYTDDQPINTGAFPSNWELSAARAASVARLFSEHGVDPRRLGIFGWGQFRPVADNATAEGRNRNRRVTIVVLSDRGAPARFFSDQDRLEAGAGSTQQAQPHTGDGEPATPNLTIEASSADGGAPHSLR